MIACLQAMIYSSSVSRKPKMNSNQSQRNRMTASFWVFIYDTKRIKIQIQDSKLVNRNVQADC